LFYHKRTHYLFGSSPLVVWLKPYMVPEILGIAMPEQQMAHQPENYTNYADHMKQV
jgi:snurportin-1